MCGIENLWLESRDSAGCVLNRRNPRKIICTRIRERATIYIDIRLHLSFLRKLIFHFKWGFREVKTGFRNAVALLKWDFWFQKSSFSVFLWGDSLALLLRIGSCWFFWWGCIRWLWGDMVEPFLFPPSLFDFFGWGKHFSRVSSLLSNQLLISFFCLP